jgi:hypothetical protein
MIKRVQYGQNLMDVAIQQYGSAASLVELAAANNLPIDADLQPGAELTIPDTYPASAIPVFADYLKQNNQVVVSAESPAALEILITNDGESLDGILL